MASCNYPFGTHSDIFLCIEPNGEPLHLRTQLSNCRLVRSRCKTAFQTGCPQVGKNRWAKTIKPLVITTGKMTQ